MAQKNVTRDMTQGSPLKLILTFSLPLLGGFLFHIIWEANSRYIFSYSLLLMPYCAAGIHAGIRKLLPLMQRLLRRSR